MEPRAPDTRWAMAGFCVTTFLASISLVGGWFTIELGPINQTISDLKQDGKDIRLTMAPLLTLYAQHKSDEGLFVSLQTQIDGKLDRDVHDLFAATTGNRISALIETNNAALAEISHQTHELESKIVSREENAVHWAATDALTLRMNALSDRNCAMGAK